MPLFFTTNLKKGSLKKRATSNDVSIEDLLGVEAG
jgi:hypothetical protein